MTGAHRAACAEMLYLDLPLIDRINRIADRGLLVEMSPLMEGSAGQGLHS